MSKKKEERNKKIIEMHRAGMSFAEIGKQLNITKQTAHQAYKRDVSSYPQHGIDKSSVV